MSEDGPLFILAGNGPYENRGCEAIVRGTVKILREQFKDPRFISISHFQSEEQFREQCLKETDRGIVHLASQRLSKMEVVRNFWKPEIWRRIFQYYLNPDAFCTWTYGDMLPYLGDAAAVLSVGGDNYSLDYGVPTLFTTLDDIILHNERPIVLWGASVGPFNAIPDYEHYMSNHLQKVTGIFARESATIKYLEGIGVTRNVYSVADPAFLMDPVRPNEDVSIDNGAIGINLSPLMARYVTGGDVEQWRAMAAAIIENIARWTERQIYLIPHVTSPHSDDHDFMQKAISLLPDKCRNLTLIPPKYNAAETKWIISKMALFAGARTHSTIAALSSGVPTLSFTYSIKSQGINHDIFGHTDYCIKPTSLNPEAVVDRVTFMLDETTAIRNDLTGRIPAILKAALSAGEGLRHLIGKN
jgi:polysaccharide pyruvyl transferase WcaK-like protein